MMSLYESEEAQRCTVKEIENIRRIIDEKEQSQTEYELIQNIEQ